MADKTVGRRRERDVQHVGSVADVTVLVWVDNVTIGDNVLGDVPVACAPEVNGSSFEELDAALAIRRLSPEREGVICAVYGKKGEIHY
ncbi:hypothetical protein HPB50_014493 [Hyalomma asiaticum]|uniref:Uncharacterized protein n=1 Tax=Hyalomma asiaticum TaxID=266040 RepID=A0ACB7SL51_HYAAI|nr:hypothetical protein HPB50_014493 [Hyalomma asiaticum]